MWTRRAWLPGAGSVPHSVRAHPRADPHTSAATDRLTVRSGTHRVAFARPDAGCDGHAVTQAYRSPDATPDRDADRTAHGPPDATPDRGADATPDRDAGADHEAHAVAAEQARPARIADK